MRKARLASEQNRGQSFGFTRLSVDGPVLRLRAWRSTVPNVYTEGSAAYDPTWGRVAWGQCPRSQYKGDRGTWVWEHGSKVRQSPRPSRRSPWLPQPRMPMRAQPNA